jgi:hypothetical protein
MILTDTGNALYSLCGLGDSASGKTRGGIYIITTTYITLMRTDAMLFDGAAFDDPAMNRGYIFVWYVE